MGPTSGQSGGEPHRSAAAALASSRHMKPNKMIRFRTAAAGVAAAGMLAAAGWLSPAFSSTAASDTAASDTATSDTATSDTATSGTGDCGSITTCFTPAQLRAAYGIQPLTEHGINGRGETVVIPAVAES